MKCDQNPCTYFTYNHFDKREQKEKKKFKSFCFLADEPSIICDESKTIEYCFIYCNYAVFLLRYSSTNS